MSFDVREVRSHFPSLSAGTAHFDGPGGTQVPDVVADAVRAALSMPIANRGRVSAAERNADDIVTGARSAMADLLGAQREGIVFGRSMTQLTYDFARTISKDWRAGDEVVVTRLDHDANIRPWMQAAERVGAVVRWADFDPDSGELRREDVEQVMSDRTRLVAVTGASNLIGTRPDVAAIAELAHAGGALCYLDGVHLSAHVGIDFAQYGADFFACSPYKFFGPHCGVLAGVPEVLAGLQPDKLLPSADTVPERFELGTLPYELLAGTTAAVEFISTLSGDCAGTRRERLGRSMSVVSDHEDRLRLRIEQSMQESGSVLNHSRAARRTPTLLLSLPGRDSADAYRYLADRGVNAPAGSFYALLASRRLGLGDRGGLRVGLAPYCDDADVDRLLEGLADFLRS